MKTNFDGFRFLILFAAIFVGRPGFSQPAVPLKPEPIRIPSPMDSGNWEEEIPILGNSRTDLSQNPPSLESGVYIHREPRKISVAYRTRFSENTQLIELDNGVQLLVRENRIAPRVAIRCFVRNTGSSLESESCGYGLSRQLAGKLAVEPIGSTVEKELMYFSLDGSSQQWASLMQFLTLQLLSRKAGDFSPGFFGKGSARSFSPNPESKTESISRDKDLETLLEETIYRTHPLRIPVSGYPGLLEKTPEDLLFEFYRKRICVNNLLFVLCGDLETESVVEFSRDLFSDFPRGPVFEPAIWDEFPQHSARFSVVEREVKTLRCVLAFPTVRKSDPDRGILELAALILQNRLNEALESENLVHLRLAQNSPQRIAGYFSVQFTTLPQHFEKTKKIVLQQIRRLQEENVSPGELQKAKKRKESTAVFSRETLSQMSEKIGEDFLVFGDPFFEDKNLETLKSVSPEEIREKAKRYFREDRLHTVCIAPIGFFPASGENRSEKDSSSEIQMFRLSNGVRLLTKRETQIPMVNLQVVVLGGNLIDTEESAGRGDFVAAMLEQGNAKFTSRELREAVELLGADFRIECDRSTITANMNVLRADWERALEILAECCISPTFSHADFGKTQTKLQARLLRRKEEPRNVLEDFFALNLPSSTPYHLPRRGTLESLSALKIEDLRAYHRRCFIAENAVLTVFGDVDPEAVRELANRTFGKMSDSTRDRAINTDRNNLFLHSIEAQMQDRKIPDALMLGYPIGSAKNTKESAVFTLLSELIAGDEKHPGWIDEELKASGLSNRAGAELWTGAASGYFVLYADCAPGKINGVLSKVEQMIDRTKNGPISPREFHAAKERILARETLGNSTLQQQARRTAREELYGNGYQNTGLFLQHIRDATLEELLSLSRKYFIHRILVKNLSP